ncbi:MAG: hypothetical protein LAT64_06300 [Phycisphaerales bacterium]|nr:hypothetical protein [Planctomycetota bacterium]MCH8508366.1 hypothetical protein [Phycisphaerales bacterium]
MAGGQEYSRNQRKIIDRYYQNEDTIVATRLAEIVSDMALAEGDQKKLDRLWKRAEQALARSKLNQAEIRTVLEKRDIVGLGRLAAKAT